ncbi:MAG: RDD family protein [Chitinophagaceae bacterium]|nr:RDD family protein [Chitinophagaceae bacterium]
MEQNSELNSNIEQKDLLADDAYLNNHFVYATQGQRFLNYLIDNILMRYGLSYLTGITIGTLLAVAAPEFLDNLADSESNWTIGMILVGLLVGILNYIVYYTICEKLFRGYTLGKLITGTRAIRQDGNELTFKDALLRSLSRLVPFEVFSGFNTLTWHDSWTETMVIKAR